jgi:hypothetical protein
MSSTKNNAYRLSHLETKSIITGQSPDSQDTNPILINLWNDIESEQEGLVRCLEQAYHLWQTSLNLGLNPGQSTAKWHSYLSDFKTEIAKLNVRIHDFNRLVPLSNMQKSPYIAAALITKLPGQAR